MKKKKVDIVSLFGAALILFGASTIGYIVSGGSKNEDTNSDEVTIIEDDSSAIIKYGLNYTNDTVDVNESIESLHLYQNNVYPYSSYKYVRFIDYDNNEKYSIVNVFVDFLSDPDKNVVETVYNYVDVFRGRTILSTNDRDKVRDYISNEVQLLIEIGDLLELRNSVISKGLDIGYAYSVMGDDIVNKSLSAYDVAWYYVLLVNSSNRLTSEYTMSIN